LAVPDEVAEPAATGVKDSIGLLDDKKLSLAVPLTVLDEVSEAVVTALVAPIPVADGAVAEEAVSREALLWVLSNVERRTASLDTVAAATREIQVRRRVHQRMRVGDRVRVDAAMVEARCGCCP